MNRPADPTGPSDVTGPEAFQVTDATDPTVLATEIAAVLAAVSSARSGSGAPGPTAYERWRRGRLEALRNGRCHGVCARVKPGGHVRRP